MAVQENQETLGGWIVREKPQSTANLQAECKIRFSELGARAFRINVGMGWTSNKIIKLKNGDLLLKYPRPFHTGVKEGYSDLTGYNSVIITQEMVGQKFARFFAGEIKSGRDTLKPKQRDFLDAVREAGGTVGVIRSVDDCEGVLGM